MSFLTLSETAAPSTPAAAKVTIYADTSGDPVLTMMDDGGNKRYMTPVAEGISATKTANSTILTYTPAAAAGRYRISASITNTSGTNTGTGQLTLDYVDSQGTTHTADILALVKADGTIVQTGTAASKEFHAVAYHFTINNAATNIVLKLVITGSVNITVAYCLERLN